MGNSIDKVHVLPAAEAGMSKFTKVLMSGLAVTLNWVPAALWGWLALTGIKR